MPRKTKDGQRFDQNTYMAQWSKENMASISVRYKKEFVQEFREACAKLGIKQSDVYRKAMQEVIEKVKVEDDKK